MKNDYLKTIFKTYGETKLIDFSTKLFDYTSPKKIDSVLLDAFYKECIATQYPITLANQLIQQLQQSPVLQTAHHITPTNGPTFLTLDLMSLSGIPKNNLYIVGANSGVPFSNTAWSGALSYQNLSLSDLLKVGSHSYKKAEKSAHTRKSDGEQQLKLSLIPSKMRDDLVFGKPIPDSLFQVEKDFQNHLKNQLDSFEVKELYSHWCARTCTKIQRNIFETENIVYLDINRVIAAYISEILNTEKEHPIYQLFFEKKIVSKINQQFKHPVFFYTFKKGKKSNKLVPIYWKNHTLYSEISEISLNRFELAKKLKENELCPGLFILFFVLQFLNGIRCLGSYYQIEYVEHFRQNWETLNLDWDLYLKPEWEFTLTTGRILKNGNPLWPLELTLFNQKLSIEEYKNIPMNFFWQYIHNVLDKV